MLRYGRQTVSVDVNSGVLLFDRKAVTFGVERISHERSEAKQFSIHISCKCVSCWHLLGFSPSDCQAPEQNKHGHRQSSQRATGDDLWECTGEKAWPPKLSHSHPFLLLMEWSPSSRNVTPSVTSSSWWNRSTQSRVNLMWSLCLLARGTWVNSCHLPAEAPMQSVFIPSLWLCLVFAGGSPPPRALQTWTTCCGLGHTPDEATALLPHDIYAVGTQENPQGEKEWSEHVKATLRSYTHIEFKQVINLFKALFTQCSV